MDLLSGQQRTGPQTGLKVPTIRIHVPLDQATVNINFTALAEQKYGWDALHPVAARLRALNRYETDDESDSEAPAADPPGTKSLTNGSAAEHVVSEIPNCTSLRTNEQPAPAEREEQSKKKRRRRKDLEYYDITDPFIDDDELVLQERTAASKDGFFVFQGPLVAEGEKVRIEKSDGTARRGGKGSRGGRGGRGRGGSAVTRTPGRPKSAPTAAVKTNGADVTAPTVQGPPPAKNSAPAATSVAVEVSAPDDTPKTPQPSQQRADIVTIAAPGDGTSSTEQTKLTPTSPGSLAGASLPGLPNVTITDSTDGQSMINAGDRSREEHTPTGDTSQPGQSDTQQSPLKRRKLSAAVLARRTEKAAERALLKAAEKAAAKAQKHALRTAAKAEKDARKAVRASKHASSGTVANVSAITANASVIAVPSTPVALTTARNESPASLPGSVAGTPTGVEHIQSASPQIVLNPDGTVRKPRKPPREKTAEEKAELARRARETRERKKAERKAAMDQERAALLARAIANPNIDTSGLQFASLQSRQVLAAAGVISDEMNEVKHPVPPPAAAITEEMNQIKQEMVPGSQSKFGPDLIPPHVSTDIGMPDFDSTQEAPQAANSTIAGVGSVHIPANVHTQILGPPRTESPSGRSMNVDAILQ